MKLCSNSKRIFSPTSSRIFSTIGSFGACAGAPPRLSSQFGPHSILSIGSPVSCETGRAVGMSSPAGASVRFLYS